MIQILVLLRRMRSIEKSAKSSQKINQLEGLAMVNLIKDATVRQLPPPKGGGIQEKNLMKCFMHTKNKWDVGPDFKEDI